MRNENIQQEWILTSYDKWFMLAEKLPNYKELQKIVLSRVQYSMNLLDESKQGVKDKL